MWVRDQKKDPKDVVEFDDFEAMIRYAESKVKGTSSLSNIKKQ